MQNGIPVAAHAGEAAKNGIVLEWKYDPEAQLLEVECVHAPFWIDAARVHKKLSEEIQSTMDSYRAA